MERLIAVVAAAVLLVGCGDAASSTAEAPDGICERTGPPGEEAPFPSDLVARFDPAVVDAMAAMSAVGMTVAIQCAESPIYVKGHGTADLAAGAAATAGTVYEIGSITKQMVAATVLKLAGAGALGLDDAVGRYLPWLPADWRPVTLRQLLSHTGGLPDHFAIFREDPDTLFIWTRDPPAAELAEALLALDDRLAAPPGSSFSYSNTGYVLLAAVIEHVTAQPLALALDEMLFATLGLAETALCSPSLPGLAVGYNVGAAGPVPGPELPASFLSGAAGVCGSAPDLVRWQRALIDGTAAGSDAYRLMRTPARLHDGTGVPYGLGLHLDELGDRPAAFHEGGTASFSSWLAYYPDHRVTIAVLCNTLGPEMAGLQDLVVQLADAALEPTP